MIFFLLACAPTAGEGDWSPPAFQAPSIDTFSWECIEEEDLWRFEVLTQGWTANGKLWLLDTQSHLEEHSILSIGAAADQSSDRLKLELSIVGDWRDAQKGKSTRWQCFEKENLEFLIQVFHPKDFNVTDCRYTGTSWGVDPLPSCDILWEE